MTAPREPEIDPQSDAASIRVDPVDAEQAARDRGLAELFGDLVDDDLQPAEVDDTASREHLAALFAGSSDARPAAAASETEPVFAWEPEPVPAAEPASAWGPEQVATAEPEPVATAGPAAAAASAAIAEPVDDAGYEPVAAARHKPVFAAFAAGAGSAVRDDSDAAASDEVVTAPEANVDAQTTEQVVDPLGAPLKSDESDADPLAWLDLVEQSPAETPEKAALGSWLGVAGLASETKLAPAVAAGADADAPTAMLPAETGATTSGSFFPAKRRGIRGWSSRVRWSVAVSIVLLIGLVTGSIVLAQSIAANNLAAQQLAAAAAELEAAEESATQPQSVLEAAVTKYADTVERARATADSAGPPLAAVAGMAAQPLLDASNAALAALVAQLDASTLDDPPPSYERGDVDMSDIAEIEAATQTADNQAQRVTTATREVMAAQTSLQEKLDALRVAQVALGASLPETAVVIVGENPDALQSFRDAVIAASVAVPAAQNAGGSGDAELLAYAAAVTALRGDQARAIAEGLVYTPPSTETNPAPNPAPAPDPVPPPAPEPTTPAPDPTTPAPEPTESTPPADPIVP